MSLSFALKRLGAISGRNYPHLSVVNLAPFVPFRSIRSICSLSYRRALDSNPNYVALKVYSTGQLKTHDMVDESQNVHARNSKVSKRGKRRVKPPKVEEKEECLSVAVEMLAKNTESGEQVCPGDTKNAEEIQLEATFAELEELAAVKINEAYAVVEELSDSDQTKGDRLSNADELFETVNDSRSRTSVADPGSGKKKVGFYGTPDPSVPMSNIPCHGCGALLHCQDPGVSGYVPSQKFLSIPDSKLKDITCQRCHLLTEFNIAVDVSVGASEYEAIVNEIKKQTALLVLLIDLTDLPNSFHKMAAAMVERKRPLYVIGNKVDLLPRDDDGYLGRIKESILKLCQEYGLSREDVKHIALISAKTGYGIEDLITQLMKDWNRKGQIYLLGCTNAGKSTLFNALLSSDFCRSSARDVIQRATTSIWPGTTLNLLKFPIVNPKPSLMHKRIERLQIARLEENEEKILRRQSLKASGHAQHATLIGHIGTSFLTPKEVAIEDQLSKYSGFIVPSYTFEELDDTAYKQSTGEDGLIETLKPKVHQYDDSTFKFWCHDTPGYINSDQIINILTPEELLILLPKKLMKPRSFVLKPSQVMFVSGLGRIDYTQGDVSIYFTVFASDMIPVHVLKKEEATEFYEENFGKPDFGVPCGDADRLSLLPPMVGKEFTIQGEGWQESAADVVLSSIGWVSVTAGNGRSVSVTAYTPGGKGCLLRNPSLLKYAVNLRGKRIRGTAAYRTRTHKPV